MPAVQIAALLDVAPYADAWETAGTIIGNLIDSSLDDDEDARVVLTVDAYTKEEVDLTIGGDLIKIRVPRWQLERALELTRGGSK